MFVFPLRLRAFALKNDFKIKIEKSTDDKNFAGTNGGI